MLNLLRKKKQERNPIQNEDPKYLFPRGNQSLLYHQIGNINFFIFITNQ